MAAVTLLSTIVETDTVANDLNHTNSSMFPGLASRRRWSQLDQPARLSILEGKLQSHGPMLAAVTLLSPIVETDTVANDLNHTNINIFPVSASSARCYHLH